MKEARGEGSGEGAWEALNFVKQGRCTDLGGRLERNAYCGDEDMAKGGEEGVSWEDMEKEEKKGCSPSSVSEKRLWHPAMSTSDMFLSESACSSGHPRSTPSTASTLGAKALKYPESSKTRRLVTTGDVQPMLNEESETRLRRGVSLANKTIPRAEDDVDVDGEVEEVYC